MVKIGRVARTNILIVDDSDFERECLKRILEPVYNISTAKSGKSALKKAFDEQPDIILLDIIMPKLNGFDVLIQLKESEVTRDIPVLCITGLDNAEDEEKGLFLGAVDYIAKPYNAAIVKARIRTHVQIVHHIRTIEKLGMVDALTGLQNKRNFDYKIKSEWFRAVRKKSPLSMLAVDIDNFRHLNSTFGYHKGDEILRETAKAILSVLKRTSYTAVRFSGDEFAVLAPNTSLEAAAQIAAQILGAAESLVLTADDGSDIKVKLSVGVSCAVPAAADSSTSLIENAYTALSSAKNAGGSCVCLQPDASGA